MIHECKPIEHSSHHYLLMPRLPTQYGQFLLLRKRGEPYESWIARRTALVVLWGTYPEGGSEITHEGTLGLLPEEGVGVKKGVGQNNDYRSVRPVHVCAITLEILNRSRGFLDGGHRTSREGRGRTHLAVICRDNPDGLHLSTRSKPED